MPKLNLKEPEKETVAAYLKQRGSMSIECLAIALGWPAKRSNGLRDHHALARLDRLIQKMGFHRTEQACLGVRGGENASMAYYHHKPPQQRELFKPAGAGVQLKTWVDPSVRGTWNPSESEQALNQRRRQEQQAALEARNRQAKAEARATVGRVKVSEQPKPVEPTIVEVSMPEKRAEAQPVSKPFSLKRRRILEAARELAATGQRLNYSAIARRAKVAANSLAPSGYYADIRLEIEAFWQQPATEQQNSQQPDPKPQDCPVKPALTSYDARLKAQNEELKRTIAALETRLQEVAGALELSEAQRRGRLAELLKAEVGFWERAIFRYRRQGALSDCQLAAENLAAARRLLALQEEEPEELYLQEQVS